MLCYSHTSTALIYLPDQSRSPMYYTTRRTREVELLCTDCH